MYRKLLPFALLVLGAALFSVAAGVAAQGPRPQKPQIVSGSGFTYQGQLKQGGGAVTDVCDMAFGLYNAASGGAQLGTAITTTVPVTAGLFTVVLNSGGEFGANAFNGDARWLDIQVHCPSGVGSFTTLAPRQALTAAPYALFAAAPWMSSGSNLYYNVGKVGIGITTPVQLLHMNVITGQGEGIEIDSPVAGHEPAIYLNHTGAGGREYRIASYGDNTNPGSFRIRDETGGADRLIIDASGRVGINTIFPARTLEIRGTLGLFDGFFDSGVYRNRFGGIATELGARLINIGMNEDGTNRFGGNYTSADQGGLLRVDTRAGVNLFQFLARRAGSTSDVVEVMGISSAGNVGIGVPIPTYRLQLPNVADATGQGQANAWQTYSSRRFKSNVATIENALDKVEQMRGVTFDWTSNGKHDVGLIAEEVGRVIPEIVSYEANGVDAQSLDYSRLVAVLIEATKEQQKQIAQQQQSIDTLQRDTGAQLAEVKQQNAALEARLSALEQNVQTKSAPAAANHAEFNILADLTSGSNLVAATLLGIVVTYLARGRKNHGT
jgi:Chaperone of endosialidase